jgi:SAM-dependent MidA family methyltransferase
MKSHRYADIFDTPGSVDLTAHVDFENLSKMARRDGLSVHGPVTQRDFLRALGIELRAQKLQSGANAAQSEVIQSALSRLIDTDQMGMLFKVIALCDDAFSLPMGFHESL